MASMRLASALVISLVVAADAGNVGGRAQRSAHFGGGGAGSAGAWRAQLSMDLLRFSKLPPAQAVASIAEIAVAAPGTAAQAPDAARAELLLRLLIAPASPAAAANLAALGPQAAGAAAALRQAVAADPIAQELGRRLSEERFGPQESLDADGAIDASWARYRSFFDGAGPAEGEPQGAVSAGRDAAPRRSLFGRRAKTSEAERGEKSPTPPPPSGSDDGQGWSAPVRWLLALVPVVLAAANQVVERLYVFTGQMIYVGVNDSAALDQAMAHYGAAANVRYTFDAFGEEIIPLVLVHFVSDGIRTYALALAAVATAALLVWASGIVKRKPYPRSFSIGAVILASGILTQAADAFFHHGVVDYLFGFAHVAPGDLLMGFGFLTILGSFGELIIAKLAEMRRERAARP